ncbi:MAG: VanZ family protein [Acidobacteria bacterium]|nr:VanZ family protein [Acidobacteriota bacterium]
MIRSAPRERPWISWLYFLLCALAIFLTIPFARVIRAFVTEQWGRLTFAYVVVACVLVVVAWLLRRLRLRGEYSTARAVWVVAIAAVYLGWTALLAMESPEEAIHFLEYGLLSLLAYRALSHEVRDPSIYVAAVLLCSVVGTVDETIQWLTPGRVWALEDIGLNVASAALTQLTLWRGIRPALIEGRVSSSSWLRLCRLTMVELVLVGLSLANTPSRIAWYAARVPILGYLLHQEGVMTEYGYRYRDPEIGVFYSRFTLEKLRELDAQRGAASAATLDAYRDRYPEFLKRYSPAVDPFVHEARVHLFRRDRFVEKLRETGGDVGMVRDFSTVAHGENRILEKHFPVTLAASAYVLPADQIARLADRRDRERLYVSPVSMQVITWTGERPLRLGILGMILALAVTSRLLSR